MPVGALPAHQRPQYGAGGQLIDIQETIERVLRLSRADACVVIGRHESAANLRWAHNTVTTNGTVEEASLSIVSIVGRRVASVTRTYFPPELLEGLVRESEAACARKPEAPDFMPLVESTGEGTAGWDAPPVVTDIHVFDTFAAQLGAAFERARRVGVGTFGYAVHTASTLWLASSAGLRRRYSDRLGKVEITAKPPDFSRSSWTGVATADFSNVDPRALFATLERRLAWAERRIDLPAGPYEVLLEPSCTADFAIGAYAQMTRRDADEGRSPFSKPGGTRIGDRLFGSVTIYSDPVEPDVPAAPFHSGVASDSGSSAFDNGLALSRTEWVRDGVLCALAMPRYWAAKTGAGGAVPFVDNLIVAGRGPTMEEMIARTKRALLVTCLWYIRTVDPQTALQTGLTRDGVFLVEDGEVRGAVNNFRWNMSPIAAFAQTTEIGRSAMALPREHDEFLRVKAPPVRVERFNMSSRSDAM
jgi:predicted Zn-dependent protease